VSQRDRLLGLIDDLYAAPGGHTGWLVFLDHVCDALNGSGASFISLRSGERHANVATTVRTDPRALELYREHWGALDPWGCSPRLAAVRPSTVVVGDELISHCALKQTAFYCDFGRSYDIARCIVGMVETGPQGLSVISINGTERRGAFATDDAALFTALMPHVRRGLQLHRRLLTAEARPDDLTAVVELSPHAVLLVNTAGHVTFKNQAATELVAKRDGLTTDAGELRAARGDDTNRLRTLIAEAGRTSSGQDISAGGTLALGRPSGRRPLTAVVSPLSRRRSGLQPAELASAMVIVMDHEETDIPGEDVLRLLFRLTPAEATLTRLVAAGMSLTDATTHLDLRVATIRTRMKAIFEKTNTNRQADLVRVVLNATRGLGVRGGATKPTSSRERRQ
jgi:DNA-binding CsgD family transcriptional regulator